MSWTRPVPSWWERKGNCNPRAHPQVSNEQGEFTITDLAPGAYKLTVSYVGFQPFESDVTWEMMRQSDIDIKMQVASVGESVLSQPNGRAAKPKRSIALATRTTSCRCSPPR